MLVRAAVRPRYLLSEAPPRRRAIILTSVAMPGGTGPAWRAGTHPSGLPLGCVPGGGRPYSRKSPADIVVALTMNVRSATPSPFTSPRTCT